MGRQSNYDKTPFTPVGPASSCEVGWTSILERLAGLRTRPRCVLVVECYPGVDVDGVRKALTEGLRPTLVVDARQAFKDPAEVERLCAPYLGDDPVFGRLNGLTMADFLEPGRRAVLRGRVDAAREGLVLVFGPAAALVAGEPDVLVYANLARWEIQQRQRRHETSSLGVHDARERPAKLYKRGFFVDWRAADRLKRTLFDRIDWLLDTTARAPRMITGEDYRAGLAVTARRPFRVVPFFDPGPWGGQWMKEVCDLPRDAPNYAWCFDCVPEENSLLLGFGGERVEVPAIDLVFRHPRPLLGEAVHARFGVEFPIRFDFLDTMGGGNLSLQVHPLTEYIQDRFGMPYTQDESYYLLDAGGEGACVYLGVREGASREAMVRDLRRAQEGGFRFPDELYVNRWPAKKHDHFLIPGGTVHCSGRDSMVLEISATPFIFTFKLWDWDRLGLDGRPRPIHIDHGAANIQWERDTAWVERELVNRIEPLGRAAGWREERTGLHEREFIETRRHWFTGPVPHDTAGGVNVLNLVEGEEAVVESPAGAFDPFVVHYAETFVLPAAAGAYTIRPHGVAEGTECATIKAFVRTRP